MKSGTFFLLVTAALWTAPAEAAPRSQACKAVAPGTVAGEQRIALVMGNRAYDGEWDELPTSVNNDADRMERKLKGLGFGVIRGHDLDKEGMDNCILKLRTAIGMMGEKSLVVVYYSGHGMGIDGRSFLAPVGSHLPEDVKQLDGALLNVQTMVSWIGSSVGRTNLLFLDSCRNNKKYLKSGRGPSKGFPEPSGTGFTKLGLTGQSGTVIAYAVDPGRVASAAGGDGDTSLYTGTLLRNLDTPGVSLMTALNNTIRDVKAVSDQTPWIEGDTSLLEPIVFTPSAPTDPADDMAWAKSQGENTVAAYRRYERDFPKGSHVTEARVSVQVLERLPAAQLKNEIPHLAQPLAGLSPPPPVGTTNAGPSNSDQRSTQSRDKIKKYFAIIPFVPPIFHEVSKNSASGIQVASIAKNHVAAPGTSPSSIDNSGNYSISTAQLSQGAAGLAYQVLAITPDNQMMSVDPANHSFNTGDRFLVWVTSNMPGLIKIKNINPNAIESDLGSIPVKAGQPVRLPAQGAFDFRNTKGRDRLVLTLVTCEGEGQPTVQRDIAVTAEAPPTSYTYPASLPSCQRAHSSSAPNSVRDIGLVSFDEGTSFATADFTQAELQSGLVAPRSVTITFQHR